MLDDKDEFRRIGIFADRFLEEAKALIGQVKTISRGPERTDWCSLIKSFMIRSDGIITPAINAALGIEDVG
jgi:hypothetical protein